MVTQAPHRRAVAIAIAFALSCVGLIIFVWTQFGGTIPFAPQGYRVKALFSETGLLVPGADVRISGVNIGRVVAVQARGIDSLVTMNISQPYAPLPADTHAILREKTLLGEAYITLSSGNRSGAKLPDDGTLPHSQIQPAQGLDQVLNSFTPPVQRNLEALLTGTGQALSGRGENFNDALGNLDPTTTELQALISALNQEQGGLQALVNDGGSVLTTLGNHRADLQSLVTAGDSVLSATAQRNAALTHTVDDLPPFLSQLHTTLGRLNTTLGIAKPSLAALAPVAPLLTPALRDLSTLTGPVVTLLRNAPAVLRDAEKALPAITRFNTDFRPALNALLPAAQQIVPVIAVVADFRLELLAGMSNLGSMLEATAPANTPSGSAHYLRAEITLGSDSAYGQPQRAPSNRSNTYSSPGELNNLATGLFASSCSNVNNSAATSGPGTNVPCRLQAAYPWRHGIKTAYFPHVLKAAK